MFENVQFFSHLHFKIVISAIMTQKKFFLKNIIMGIKKTQNFMLISNLFFFFFFYYGDARMINHAPLYTKKNYETIFFTGFWAFTMQFFL